jgi:hypothetical protein
MINQFRGGGNVDLRTAMTCKAHLDDLPRYTPRATLTAADTILRI